MNADPENSSPGDLLDRPEPVPDDWLDLAACKGRTTLFFGAAGERPERRVRRESRAAKVCAGCPVRWTCRASARLNRENGFWGGESEEDRAAAGFPPRSIARRSVQSAAHLPSAADPPRPAASA